MEKSYPPLPSNYNVCERRTKSLARWLAETPDILQTYGDIISEHQSRGFVEQVLATPSTHNVHYIPNHPVRKESSTTPIRIVYDCSCCQSYTQPSLNDCLMAGPWFLSDLCGILLRFCTHKFGCSSDIENAFLPATLHEDDRDYTRFLWLSDTTNPDSDFNIYHFKVVLFGSVSSPFMLNVTLYYHLCKFSTRIAADIEINLYVDNVISACDSETDAVNYYNTYRSIMSQTKFNLWSWTSNSTAVHSLAWAHDVAERDDTAKALGLLWHTPSDTLSHGSKIAAGDYPVTKWEIC